MKKAFAIAAVAGLAGAASAQTMHISADVTSAMASDTITWTVSITGLSLQTIGGTTIGGDYLQGYDLNFVASNAALGDASAFSAFAGSVSPTGGTPAGASINGVTGGQSSILGGVAYGNLVIGTFTVHAGAVAGDLSYGLADGGILSETNAIQVKNYDFFAGAGVPNGDFGDDVFNGVPQVVSDTVTITAVPTPASAALIGLGGLVATRRRR